MVDNSNSNIEYVSVKNYNQPSIELRKSDLWFDFYSIPNMNSLNGMLYDCSVSIADFDGDGKDDIIMSPTIYPNIDKRTPVQLFINDNNNKFILNKSIFTTNIGANNSRKSIIGDFNGDGKPDVVFIESGVDVPPYTGSSPSMLLSGSKGYDFKLLLSDTWFGHGGCSGDIDNDGDLDIFLTGNKPYLLLNDGKGNFTNVSSKVTMPNANVYTCEMKDINKDGYIDLIVGGADNTSLPDNNPARIIFGNGNSFNVAKSIILPTIPKWGNIVDINFGDMDGDGIDEIILNRTQDVSSGNNYWGYRIQVLKAFGDTYQDITEKIMENYYSFTSKWIVWIRVEDIDKNGKLDIFDADKGHQNTNTVLRWEKDIDGIFRR